MSFIRESASNRRVSQDALLTNLTVSDNCVLPCLDDRIKSILSSQVTQISQNISSNPYLVSEVTINRDQLYSTAPRFTGTSGPPPNTLVFDYPTGVTITTNSQPNPNEGLITLVPAPGANKLIVPRIIEIVAPHSTLPDPSYAAGLTNAGAAPDLIFQLWNRYPVKTDDTKKISGQSVIGPQFSDNKPNFQMNDVKMINNLSLASISMKGGVGSTVPGLPLIDNTPATPETVDKFDFSFRVLLSSTQSFPGFEGVTLKVGTYPTGTQVNQVRGFDFSPVNQPLTLYVDQPLTQNKGRDFTIRVHYNIVPSLD
jgi:hypothetical protein